MTTVVLMINQAS